MASVYNMALKVGTDGAILSVNVPAFLGAPRQNVNYEVTLAETMSLYPDFSPVMTILVSNMDAEERARDTGFSNVLNMFYYQGKNLYFKNGAYLKINPVLPGNTYLSWTFYDSNNDFVVGGNGPTEGDGRYWAISFISNGKSGNTNHYYMHQLTLASGKKLLHQGGQIPSLVVALDSNYYEGAAVPNDPYSEIVPSSQQGGWGDFDFYSSDDVGFPSLPELSAIGTGFVSLWSPSVQQMLNLSSYMWNADVFTMEFWKKLIADPLQLIYGLNIIPLDLETRGLIGGEDNVVVGLINTGIKMNYLISQWAVVDCGEIYLDEKWGAYLDYDPYTKLEIYLPYIGIRPLKMDDFMPGHIHVKYHVDLLTGSCVAFVKSTKDPTHNDELDSVIYQFMGNCATQIPVTAAQYADAVKSAISLAASIGSMVATGIGGAGAVAGAQTSNAIKAINARTIQSELNTGASAIENVMSMKPSIERSGALGGSAGLLAIQYPYLILTRARQAQPVDQNVYTGYPSFMTQNLGELNGWTMVQAIHLDNIPCTSEEMTEIDELLKGGVIL